MVSNQSELHGFSSVLTRRAGFDNNDPSFNDKAGKRVRYILGGTKYAYSTKAAPDQKLGW